MSRLNTFKEKNYEICAVFEKKTYDCAGCVWSRPRGCGVPRVFYRLNREEMTTLVEDICHDLTT